MSMKKILSRAAVAAALLATAGFAAAATASVTVDSFADSVQGPHGTVGKDTGLDITAGEFITITVDPLQLWNNSSPDASYLSNANGHDGSVDVNHHPDFNYTQGSDTFAFGALVGEIGNGAFFLVGTNYSAVATGTGDLKLFYWDSDYGNNVGSVVANISVVPEPANLALMALALGAFALTRRRKA
jgi:hypothetical protein